MFSKLSSTNMTKFIIATIVLGALLFIGCNRKKTKALEETTKIEEPKIQQAEPEQPTEIIETATEETTVKVETPPVVALLISLKKTPCFGKCPVFEIQLFSDGKVNYKGDRFVEKIGLYEAQITAQEALDLVEEIKKMGFFEMEKEYPKDGRKITDLPSTITNVIDVLNRKNWTVTNNHHAPRAMNAIEKMILEKLEVLEFTKSDQTNK